MYLLAIFDYLGPMHGLLYGRCMASAAIVAGAWFIPTQWVMIVGLGGRLYDVTWS